MSTLPAVTGKELQRLLICDGWEPGRRATHGISFSKLMDNGHKQVVIVPDKSEPLARQTLHQILSDKQTGIGRDGLVNIHRYGLK